MKTYLTYGVIWAIAGLVLTVVLYLLGYHSDPAKMTVANYIGGIGGLAIAVACLVFGIRARRDEVPATENFGYGRALGAGVMVALVASVIGIFTTYLYAKVINPEFVDVLVQTQVEKLESKGLSAAQVEGAEKMIRTMSGPGVQAIFACLGGMLFGTIISAIAAAFLKRPAAPETFAAPPALS